MTQLNGTVAALETVFDPDQNVEQCTRCIAGGNAAALIDSEWLVTNALGGYASGTLAGAATRRYHGLLVAAHPAPLGRVMLLNHLTEQFRFRDHSTYSVGLIERARQSLELHGLSIFKEFRLEMGLPVWQYEVSGHILERRIYMPHRQNTVHVSYRLIKGEGPVQVKLRICVHFRGHDEHVSVPNPEPYVLTACAGRYELSDRDRIFPALRLVIDGDSSALTLDEMTLPDVLYRV